MFAPNANAFFRIYPFLHLVSHFPWFKYEKLYVKLWLIRQRRFNALPSSWNPQTRQYYSFVWFDYIVSADSKERKTCPKGFSMDAIFYHIIRYMKLISMFRPSPSPDSRKKEKKKDEKKQGLLVRFLLLKLLAHI